jgi:HTH-type transcriptional regulator/antitoxin MqsA
VEKRRSHKERGKAMKCLSCGKGRLVRDTRDVPHTYKGETTMIPAVRGDFCVACGESVLAAAEASRVSAVMLEFNKQVNASIVDPGFIARVRKKLAIDQREAAAIFGDSFTASYGRGFDERFIRSHDRRERLVGDALLPPVTAPCKTSKWPNSLPVPDPQDVAHCKAYRKG